MRFHQTRLTQPFQRLLAHFHFRWMFGCFLCLNGVVLGLETLPQILTSYYQMMEVMDWIFAIGFTIEMGIRFLAKPDQFFKTPWDLFDLLIVGISWSIICFPESVILRSLRILRLLRLIELLPHLSEILGALKRAFPGILNVGSILLILFYIFSVMATQIYQFQHTHYFSNLAVSARTLFQLMLADNWGEIMGSVNQTHPYSLFFFIPFIVVMTFTILNLFVGLIVNAMETAAEDIDLEQTINGSQQAINRTLQPTSSEPTLSDLQKDIQAIQAYLKTSSYSGSLQ